ncbi:MAG: AAA family ATPase [Actinomycetota bacterium]
MNGPHRRPAVAETHISTVFFSADRAYKLLKPLATSFLDFSTTERRLAAVDDELRLNRRMAPDVYLGVADVEEHDEVVDRMLVMRRLPADRRLTALVTSPGLDDRIRQIVRAVAAFHAAEEPVRDAADIAGRDAVARNWADNTADMAPLAGTAFDAAELDLVDGLARRYLDHSETLFDRRLADGFVRDGHGDLTAEDIFCLDDGPRILDCLAFDRRLRISDVLCDVGFLAMDLDRLAGPDAADTVWRYYAEFSNEHHPASLAHHYVAYRAHVRAKIACLVHRQGDPEAAPLARTYLHLCRRHLELARRRLVLVGGTPGTGKTTLTEVISRTFGWASVSTDPIRKELTGRAHTDHEFSAPGTGIYSPAISTETYRETFRRAGLLLEAGESVIVDASFSDQVQRSHGRALAARTGADVIELECVVDRGEAAERLARRLAADEDASDARPEILGELRAAHAPWPEAITIATDGPLATSEAAALAAIRSS